MQLKHIFFDLDGVLIDSEPLHFEAHRFAAAKYGIELALEDYMQYGVSRGDDFLYEKMSEKYDVPLDKQEISKIKKQYYRDILDEKGALMPGMLEALQKLSEEYDLAVVSSGSKSAIEYVLAKFDIKKYFKNIITGEDVEKVKPFPDIYLKVLKIAGVGKDECIAIEDSETGVEAAKNAGIECIAIPCGFTKDQDFSRADVILSDILQLNFLKGQTI